MVESPGIELALRPADHITAGGPLAERVEAFRDEWLRRGTGELAGLGAFSISVVSAPPDHVGLGTGTQLALATGAALSGFRDGERPAAVEIAERVGRGSRSGVGVHGFDRGGFLVDGGRRRGGGVAPLIAHQPIPDAWRVLLVIPRQERGLSGTLERDAFAALRTVPDPNSTRRSERLCRLLLLGILPALAERDIEAFSEAALEYGAVAGEFFRPVQGDVFASPAVRRMVEALREEGLRGVGQSSWGPTVWAWAGDEERATAIALRVRERLGLDPDELIVTRARNTGATVECAAGNDDPKTPPSDVDERL